MTTLKEHKKGVEGEPGKVSVDSALVSPPATKEGGAEVFI
jgi:hypothetical protein